MLTGPVRGALGILNSIARRRCKILIAEASYVTSFPQSVLVPNTTRVDSVFTSVTQPLRVVYVGRVSFDRGLREMIELGERLVQRGGPEVVIAGPSDDDCRAVLLDAVARGAVRWCGPIPNPEVFDVIRGSVAGLALLHDVANYRFSNPTKVWEYWSVGVPVIGTPLPSMTKMVSEAGGGVVLTVFSGPGVVEEAERAIDELSSRPERRDALGRSGWSLAGSTSDWARDGLDFVRELERLASESRTSRSRIGK